MDGAHIYTAFLKYSLQQVHKVFRLSLVSITF